MNVAYIGPGEPNADPSVHGTPDDDAGHWIELGPLRPKTRVHLCEYGSTEPGLTGLTFVTDDIVADYDRMRAKGARFLGPPRKTEWGEWLAEFVDLDGNEFDLKQPISTPEWTSGGPVA